MSVTSGDLVIYGSVSMPDDEATLDIGGGANTRVLVSFADIVANDRIKVSSSSVDDNTQTLTIYSRSQAGALLSEVFNLDGTSVVLGALLSTRVLKATLSGICTGTITVRDEDTETTIMSFTPGITEIRRPFYAAYSDVSGGVERKYYEKVFYYNDNALTTLSSATIEEVSDPEDVVAFALESALDGSDTNGAGNSRLVAPSGYTFDSATKNVANAQNHTAGSGQGVWLELTLAAALPSANTSFTLRESGLTT